MISLRTLVIAQDLPYPPFVGRQLRTWQNIDALSGVSRVGVFGLCSNDPHCTNTPPRCLEFWRSSTDPALAYPPPRPPLAARAWPLHPLGHPSDLYYSDSAATQIADAMASFRPHIVVVEGLWLYRYIELLKQLRCRIVLDCHNVEAALYQEIADATHGDELPARLIRKLLPTRTKIIEEKVVQAVDQIWVCSNSDASLMKNLYRGSAPIHVVPNAVDVASYKGARGRQYQRPDEINLNGKVLIFSALFGWAPNIVAVSFLIDEFFPRLVTAFPDAQLVLAGSRPTSEMLNSAREEPRIVVTGAVSDMRPYLAAADGMVVPLFQGGGTRFKILEAFAANLPVISTAKGAEGLAVKDGKHLLLAETADEFVEAVKRLWTDKCLAKQLAANGLELVKRSYSFPTVSQQIAYAVNELGLDG